MTRSKNGKWIIDDERFQYIVMENQNANINKILKYSYGFNSIEIVYETIKENGETKLTETTLPRNYFKRVVKSSIEDAMEHVVKHFSTPLNFKPDLSQRLFEYRHYLAHHFPEKLI